MTFQFKCPQGCLLEGDSSQAGQQIACPVCGVQFIIPAPPSTPAIPAWPGPHGAGPGGSPSATSPVVSPSSPTPAAPALTPPTVTPPASSPDVPPPTQISGGPRMPAATQAPQFPAPGTAPAEPQMLHIPCPNGHELETPPDMIGQEVLCPHCGVQFRLREKDSLEHKRRRAAEQERKMRRLSNAWFNWSVVVAVLVAIGLIILIISSSR